jgi:hypothetical protein
MSCWWRDQDCQKATIEFKEGDAYSKLLQQEMIVHYDRGTCLL